MSLELEGPIAIATLCRPPINAVNDEWVARLNEILDQVEADERIGVLWIRSSSRVFCAGADLEFMRARLFTEEGRVRMIDFTRDMLLMAAMGPQRSGGYSVAIERVLDQPETLFVLVRMISPGPGCGAIAALTSPVDIVRLPASPKPIRWVLERTANDCR